MRSKLLLFNCLLGKIFQQLIAKGCVLNRAAEAHLGSRLQGAEWLVPRLGIYGSPVHAQIFEEWAVIIDLAHPCRKLLHVIVAGYEVVGVVIKPISSICHVSGRHDRATILDGKTNNFSASSRHL